MEKETKGPTGPLLGHEHEPAPVPAEAAAGPVEERAAVRVDAREVDVAERRRPGAIREADRPIAVERGVAGLEGLAPLPFGELAVRLEIVLELLPATAVADRDELPTPALGSLDRRAVVLPTPGIAAIGADHLERLVLRRGAVERQLEDLVENGVGFGFQMSHLLCWIFYTLFWLICQ